MNKEKNTDQVEALLKIAGPRMRPDEKVYQEVYANVHTAWKQQKSRGSSFKHVFRIAAGLFLVVGLLSVAYYIKNDELNQDLQISKSLILSGQIQVSQDRQNWSILNNDSSLAKGDYIKTSSNNRILTALKNGNVFRLNENTLIHIIDENEIELYEGQIYIESNEDSPYEKLLVKTKYGLVRHIGTQYIVEIKPDSLNVSVRKGKVIIQNDAIEKELMDGFELSINGSGAYAQSAIEPFDLKWQWTQKIAEHFNIQDKSVFQYLTWLSNETGYPVIWSNRAVKKSATKIILSGSIKGLSPLESLDVILPTTDFKYEMSKTAIHISN